MSKGFGNLMRQAQQMQKKMAAVQEELKSRTVDGEAGQGKVKATVTGGYEVKSISIDRELIDPEDTGMIEDMVAVAVNDAIAKARQMKEEEMGKLAGGLPMNIPGLF